MRIVILAIGTLGDVLPYIALGTGLKEDGHATVIATHPSFKKTVSDYNLEFTPIEYPQGLMTGTDMLELVDAGGNFLSWMRKLSDLTGPILRRLLDDCWQACQQSETIVYSPFGWAGYHIAQKMGIPSYAASLQPISRTRCFPAVWSPVGWRLGGCYNLTTYRAIEQVFWQVFRKATNQWRQEVLELEPIRLNGPFNTPEWKQQPFLYGYSPSIIPRPSDWPEWLHVTGYWFLPSNNDWKPPEELEDFLDSGPPPVYIGFGSVPIHDQEGVMQIVTESLNRLGKRGILQIGRNEGSGRVSDNIFHAGWVPHEWLFPRMAAIVHHGGASTIANGLRSGVPSVIIPFAWDQPFWGRRIEKLGVGPSPIPRRKLTVDNLAQAITIATSNKQIAVNAAALGSRIRAEDGVARAVDIVSRH